MSRSKSVPIGPLSSKSTGNRHWVEPKRKFPEPTKVCNSLMPTMTPAETARLQMLSRPARPGAEQHAQYCSHGTLC